MPSDEADAGVGRVGIVDVGAVDLSAVHPRIAPFLHRLLRRQNRQRQKAVVLDLDARLLLDVGMSRDQAEHESRRND